MIRGVVRISCGWRVVKCGINQILKYEKEIDCNLRIWFIVVSAISGVVTMVGDNHLLFLLRADFICF